MDILALFKRRHECGILGIMGKHTQLNLAVVRRHQNLPHIGHKPLSNLSSRFTPDGNILQVGVAATQPTRSGNGLVKRCMHPPGFRIYHFNQSIQVGGFQFGQGSETEQVHGNLVGLGEFLKDLDIRGIPFGFGGLFSSGKFQDFKQHLSQLLRRVKVEFHTGFDQDGLFHLFHLHGKVGGHGLKKRRINFDARHLHIQEHGQKLHFQIIKKRLVFLSLDFFRQNFFQSKGHVRIFTGIFAGVLNRNLRKTARILSLSHHIPEGDHLMVQIALREGIQVVLPQTGVNHIGGNHGIK